MFTYIPNYGIIDYTLDNHSLDTNSIARLESEGCWLIYKYPSDTAYNSTTHYWFDNWGNGWEHVIIMNNPSPFVITKRISEFTKPMPDVCIENIISGKWILRGNFFEASKQLTTYITLFMELEDMKTKINLLESSHYTQMDKAQDEIWNLEDKLGNAQDEIMDLTEAFDKAQDELKMYKEPTTVMNNLMAFFESTTD